MIGSQYFHGSVADMGVGLLMHMIMKKKRSVIRFSCVAVFPFGR